MGLWPDVQQNFRDRLMCNLHVFIIFLTIVIGIIIPAVHSLIMIHSNLMLVIDNLQFVVPCVNCAIKIIIFWWKKEGKFNYIFVHFRNEILLHLVIFIQYSCL